MKKSLILILCLSLVIASFSQHAMVIGDCTVTYKISGGDAATNKNLSNATKIFYVKGRLARTDMIGPNYKQSVIYDNAKGTAVILKEIGAEKYMTTLSADEWEKQNSHFQGQTITLDDDSKKILDYDCKKAIAHLKDGSTYNMYYTSSITPSASENPFQFKDVPGFVLEYEVGGTNKSSKITYTATQINFDPVPVSKFKIPTEGYRVLK